MSKFKIKSLKRDSKIRSRSALGVAVFAVALVGVLSLRFGHSNVAHATPTTSNMGSTLSYGSNAIFGTNFSVTACRNQSVNNRSVLLAKATPSSTNLNWANGDSLSFGIDQDYISGSENNFLPLANVNIDSRNFNGSYVPINSQADYTGGTDSVNNNPAVKTRLDYAHTSFYLQEVHGGTKQAGTGNVASFGRKYRLPVFGSGNNLTGVEGSPAGKIFENNISDCSYGFKNPKSLYYASNVDNMNVLYVQNSDDTVTAINSDERNSLESTVPGPSPSSFPNYTTSKALSGKVTWSVDTANNKISYTNDATQVMGQMNGNIVGPTAISVSLASSDSTCDTCNAAWVTSFQSNAMYRILADKSGSLSIVKTISINKPNDILVTTITVPDNDPSGQPAGTYHLAIVTSGTNSDDSYVTAFNLSSSDAILSQTALPPKNSLGTGYTYTPLLSSPTALASTGRYIWVVNSNNLIGQASGNTSILLVDPVPHLEVPVSTVAPQLESLRQ